MTNFYDLTTDHKIKLKKPMGCFKNIGEVCNIVNIDTEENTLSFQFGDSGLHLGVVSSNELDKYFDVVKPKVIQDDYEWHPYGFIEGHQVMYRAEKNGGICMKIISYNKTVISTTYNHPEIGYRNIQNGQHGKFYNDDIKVAFFKLQKDYYSQLYKDVHHEVELEYFSNRDECGIEFNE